MVTRHGSDEEAACDSRELEGPCARPSSGPSQALHCRDEEEARRAASLRTPLGCPTYDCSHFIDKGSETQKGSVTAKGHIAGKPGAGLVSPSSGLLQCRLVPLTGRRHCAAADPDLMARVTEDW